jgi:hypothetical protein
MRTRIGKKFPTHAAFFISAVPAILNPGPCFIVYIDKILIIEVNLGKVVFCHLNPMAFFLAFSFNYTRGVLNFPVFFSKFSKIPHFEGGIDPKNSRFLVENT